MRRPQALGFQHRHGYLRNVHKARRETLHYTRLQSSQVRRGRHWAWEEFEEEEEEEDWRELMEDVEVLIQRMKERHQETPNHRRRARIAKNIELTRHILQDKIEDGHLNAFRPGTTRRIEMLRLVNEHLSDYDVPGKKPSIYLPEWQTEWWKHKRYHGLCHRCVIILRLKHRLERSENAEEAKRQHRIRAAKKAAETRKRNEEERQAKAAKAEQARKAKIREKERVEEWKALRKVLSPTMSGNSSTNVLASSASSTPQKWTCCVFGTRSENPEQMKNSNQGNVSSLKTRRRIGLPTNPS